MSNKKVTAKTQAIFLPKSSHNIKLDYNYRELYSIFLHYDRNHNLELNSEEIDLIKQDIKACLQNGKILNFTKLANMLKAAPNKVKDFIYRVDGNLIGLEIKEALKSKFSWFNNPERAEQFIYKINPNNINQVNYTFSDIHKSDSLAKAIVNNFSFEKAKSMLAHLAKTSSQALAKDNIDTKSIMANFNEAVENNDKKNMLKYLQMLTDMLNYRDIAHLDIVNKHSSNPNSSLDESSKKRLGNITSIQNNKDILGDGRLGNTKSYPQSQLTGKVLSTVNKLINESVFKEIAASCVSKEKNYVCTYIPKSKTTYKYNENDLVKLMESYNAPIGDGDTSNFVLSIIAEAKNENFDINNASEQELREFIKGLFLL